MKKNLTFLTLSFLFVAGKFMAQSYTPIAATGYTLDAVAEAQPATTTTGGQIDGSNYALYSQAYGALYTPVGTGLPNTGIVSAGTKTFQLQPYTAPNMLFMMAGGADSLNITTPTPYAFLSLLAISTEGAATATISVRFTDNTTQQFTGFTVGDWFGTATAFYAGFDRVSRGTGALGYAGTTTPKMFTMDMAISCANLGKSVMRIVVRNTHSNARLGVMSVAGTSTPNYVAIPVASSTNAICSPGSVTYNASTMTSYTWQPVGSFTGSNSGTITVTPTTTTTYSLFGTNAAGCPGFTTVSVNSSTGVPVYAFTGSTPTVCLGAAATISASGALTYTLSTGAANGATFAPTSTANYTVSGSNACGTSSTVVTVTVTPLTINASASSTLVCANNVSTLTANGATTYTWAPGAAGTSSVYLAYPSANTVYTVTGKTGVCLGSNTLAVSTKTNPVITIAASSPTSCSGQPVNLTVTGSAVTYTWNQGSQTAAVAVSPTISTLYSVIGTNALGCNTSASQVVVVTANPVISASASDDMVCVGGTSSLTATGPNGTTYNWSNTTSGNTTVVHPLLTTVYTATGTSNTSGCSSTTTVLITVFDPTVTVSSPTTICRGTSVSLIAAGTDNFLWSNGSNFSSINVTPTTTTTYSVTGSSLQGAITCTNMTSVVVTVNQRPVLNTSATPSNICVGESSVLNASGAVTYSWSAQTPVVNSNYTVSPGGNQTYTVSGTDANGCTGNGTVMLKVSGCVGIATNAASAAGMIIYPNPSNGDFTINTTQAINLQIVNELGQLVKTIYLTEDHKSEVVNNLATGIYFILGKNENGRVSQKIVVTK